MILARGTTDKIIPFAGYTLPGVMTWRGLHRLVKTWQLLPGQIFVVVGEGSDSAFASNLIESHRGTVVANVSEDDCREMIAEGSNGVKRVVLAESSFG
ncbi:hypothetical protein BH23CHL5_BH23CHL5_07540 [soil metagenome]